MLCKFACKKNQSGRFFPSPQYRFVCNFSGVVTAEFIMTAIARTVRSMKYLLYAITLLSSFAYADPPAKKNHRYTLPECLVIGVADGDTIKARCGRPGNYKQIKVRLSAIDAPERKQAFGNRARMALSDIAFGKQANLVCTNKDRYQRHVCKVMVSTASNPDGPKTLDAGLAMITVGLAWWHKAYSREQTLEERGQYEFAAIEAKAKRAGLWRDAKPLAPWEWRKQNSRP